jgi:hypothetical protein
MKPWSNIILTDSEIQAAIEEFKKVKWFHERTKEYWEREELKKKVNRKVTNI